MIINIKQDNLVDKGICSTMYSKYFFLKNHIYRHPYGIEYLTISRRRRGDYKPIFTQPKRINLYSLSRSEYRLVIIEPGATNCFSINFQVVTNNNQDNFIKNHFKFITVSKRQKAKSYSRCRPVTITSETANRHQSECRKINSHLEIYTKQVYHTKTYLDLWYFVGTISSLYNICYTL